MSAFLEETYKLDDVDSWIHCLEFDFDKPERIKYHYHEYIEILFFISGKGSVLINDNTYSYKANTLVIINSHRAHSIDILAPSHYVCIKVMPDILQTDNFKYLLPFISEAKNEYIFDTEKPELTNVCPLIHDVIQEWNNMSYGFELAIRSKLLEFFLCVLRYLNKTDKISSSDNIHPEIKVAVICIADNFATVTEKDIAAMCHLSYNYFSFLFKKELGKSFKSYLIEVKIHQAEKLLLSTNKTITEIAHLSGFSTTSHFISQFKNQKGMTPLRYKKLYF